MIKKAIKTKFIKCEAVLQFGRYKTGEMAISFYSTDEEPLAKVTVSCEPYGLPVLDHDREIYLKEYGENAGMLVACQNAGIIEPDYQPHAMGNVTVYRCTLTEEIINEAKKELKT